MQYTLSVGFCPADWYVPLARAAEAAGWDSIAVPDGLFYYEKTSAPYPYSADGTRFWAADTPFLDPWVVIATMAGATERIRFYPSVLKLAVRDPLLVAKELSSCAVLAGERVGLGVGLSPWPEDFEVLREDWAQRGPRSAEMIEIIRGLLQGGMYEYHGRFYDFPRLQIAPVPRKPVPVYIGGLVEPVLKRAARIADGYIGWENPRCSLDDLAQMIRRIEGYRRDYERTGAFEYKFTPYSVAAQTRQRLADIGVTDLICSPWLESHGAGAGLRERLDAVARFGDAIIGRSR